MMNTPSTLNSWLSTVNNQLTVRRIEARSMPRPKRNRERERARREARQLFNEFYAEQAIELSAMSSSRDVDRAA